LIDVAPVAPHDLVKNTRELIARKCLEDLFGSVTGINSHASSGLDSRVVLGFSQSCADVLQQILHEVVLAK